MGYTHMNDNEPSSLNDDFIRTFTVASAYKRPQSGTDVEFTIVVRDVGVVTRWLGYQNTGARGMKTTLRVSGFGGNFRFSGLVSTLDGDDDGNKGKNVFIAAGIGITPLLGQITNVAGDGAGEAGGLIVLWTVGIKDIGLAVDVLGSAPEDMKKSMCLFVTGTGAEPEGSKNMEMLAGLERDASVSGGGPRIERRRLTKDDLTGLEKSGEVEIENWYLCTAPGMRKQIQEWLDGKTVVFENFDY